MLKVGSKFRHPGDDAWCEVLEIDTVNNRIKVLFHTAYITDLQFRNLSATEIDFLIGRYEMIE